MTPSNGTRLIRHKHTGEIKRILWRDWILRHRTFRKWELIDPNDGTAGVREPRNPTDPPSTLSATHEPPDP